MRNKSILLVDDEEIILSFSSYHARLPSGNGGLQPLV